MNARRQKYIRGTLLAQLNQLFKNRPGIASSIDDTDPHTINVSYPATFAAEYIRPAVRLEIGPLASWIPSNVHTIEAYAAQSFPAAFSDPTCAVVRDRS